MRLLLQILAILCFYGAGESIARLFRLPLPGSVIGLALILLALQMRLLKPAHLRLGAHALLGRMLLFFVPAVPVLITHPEFVGMLGLRLVVVVVVGTLLVMGVTGAVVRMVAGVEDGDD